MKKWFRIMKHKAVKTNFIAFIFFLVFSGIGYLFINQFQDISYFNKQFSFNPYYINTFYNGDNGRYLINLGKETEAEKHGVLLPNDYINNQLTSMPEFQKNGKFDKAIYESFIKKNNLTQYEIWRYVKQKNTVEFFENMIIGSSKKEEVLQAVFNQTASIAKVSGNQYFLKDEVILEEVKRQMKNVSKEDLNKFFYEKTKELHRHFIDPEVRKGFLVIIPNAKVSDFNKEQLYQILKEDIDQNNAIEKISKILHTTCDLKRYHYVPKDFTVSDFLFENTNFYQHKNQVVIPFVQEIIPIKPKNNMSEKNIQWIMEEYEKMIFDQCGLLMATKLSNDFNQGKITEAQLKDYCDIQPFVKIRGNIKYSDLKFFVLHKNQSFAIKNYESRPVIFVIKDRVFNSGQKDILNYVSQIGQSPEEMTIKSLIEGNLIYWIYFFENRG